MGLGETWISFRLWKEKRKKTPSPLTITEGPHSISVIYIISTKQRRQKNVSIKGQRKNLWLIKADNETKPARQECICLKAKMAKHLRNAIQMVLFLWAPEHEDIQRSTFHIIITCQLAWKWLHICLINVGFPSYCAFRDSYHSIFFPPEGLFASPSPWISVGGKKRGTYILLAFILFPISLLPQGKSWLFLSTCRILHTSGVWHCNIFSAICILNDLKFDWE